MSNAKHIVTVVYFQGAGPAFVHLEVAATTVDWVGNLYTCLKEQDSWIKVYRLAPNNRWEHLNPDGDGPTAVGGQLTLFGVPIDASYSWDGRPARWSCGLKARWCAPTAIFCRDRRSSASCPARTSACVALGAASRRSSTRRPHDRRANRIPLQPTNLSPFGLEFLA